MAITKHVPELIQECGLAYDPDMLVSADDDLADKLFQAGKDLFLEVGAYKMDTQYIFTRKEAKEILALFSKEIAQSVGEDRGTVVRKVRISYLLHKGPIGMHVNNSVSLLIYSGKVSAFYPNWGMRPVDG